MSVENATPPSQEILPNNVSKAANKIENLLRGRYACFVTYMIRNDLAVFDLQTMRYSTSLSDFLNNVVKIQEESSNFQSIFYQDEMYLVIGPVDWRPSDFDVNSV